MSSSVFKGGARCDGPPFGSTMKIFYRRLYIKRCVFCQKWANLWFPLNIQKQKVFQLQGGFSPLTPRPGALPLDPAGGSAQTPVIDSRSTRSPCPSLCQILNTLLVMSGFSILYCKCLLSNIYLWCELKAVIHYFHSFLHKRVTLAKWSC